MAVFSQKQDEWWIILYKGKHLVSSETTATILFLFRCLIWSLVRSLNISLLLRESSEEFTAEFKTLLLLKYQVRVFVECWTDLCYFISA